MLDRKIRTNLKGTWHTMCSDLDNRLISRPMREHLLKIDFEKGHKLTGILGFEIVRVLQIALRKLRNAQDG